jgi:uncharacterized protein YsxB (DUF464 family)
VVRIRLVLDEAGRLACIDAEGHAFVGASGHDPACAATSALLRTAYHALEAERGVKAIATAASAGVFAAEFRYDRESERSEWAKGVADFLVIGLSMVVEEYPEGVSMEIEPKGRH